MNVNRLVILRIVFCQILLDRLIGHSLNILDHRRVDVIVVDRAVVIQFNLEC